MIKYLYSAIVFQEIPNETTLCLCITNCRFCCAGCHSPELQDDAGFDLERDLPDLILKNEGITCVCFMGDGNDLDALDRCLRFIRIKHPELKTALYTGMDDSYEEVYWYIMSGLLDYIKIGRYNSELGGLNSPTTNQRMYCITDAGKEVEDITHLFQKHSN